MPASRSAANGFASHELRLARQGFGVPVMPQGAFYVFADASKWIDDSYKFAFALFDVPALALPWTAVLRGDTH